MKKDGDNADTAPPHVAGSAPPLPDTPIEPLNIKVNGKERVFGADASHAWLAVWLPGTDQWLAIDPTNDQWANDRYVTVAWGRDYGDVSPVRGIIFTKAKNSTLRVSVDVAPLAVADGAA